MDNLLMNTWRPYVEVKKVTDYHSVIKKTTTESLKGQLQGGYDFTLIFTTRLEKVLQKLSHCFDFDLNLPTCFDFILVLDDR